MLAKHGAVGPYLWLVLILEAKRQQYDELDKAARRPGRVKLGWAALAQLVATDVHTARKVIADLVELDELTIEDQDYAFIGQLHDWQRWEVEPADPKEAARKRTSRVQGTESGQRPVSVRPESDTATATETATLRP